MHMEFLDVLSESAVLATPPAEPKGVPEEKSMLHQAAAPKDSIFGGAFAPHAGGAPSVWSFEEAGGRRIPLHAYKGRPRPAEPPKAPAPAPKEAPKPKQDAPQPSEPPKPAK
jgi:hypothetical protein